MNKIIILTALFLSGQSALAQIREFQTTRLMSTSGAGVASILSTEAGVLNPAASAFFEDSSFSYQSYETALNKKSEYRDPALNKFPSSNSSSGTFLSDHTGPLKGGVAFLTQNENFYERTKMVLHNSAPMSNSSSMGITYSYIQDKLPATRRKRHQVHHQVTVGMTYVLDEDTILGLVVIDPTRTTPHEERIIAGFQYDLADRFTLIGDMGAQYTRGISKHYLWRAAIQMNVFSDFFIRLGQFYDNVTQFKGTSWGASWIGPRLGVEFAQRFSQQFGSGNYIYENEQIKDTSLSLIIKF